MMIKSKKNKIKIKYSRLSKFFSENKNKTIVIRDNISIIAGPAAKANGINANNKINILSDLCS